LEFVICSLEFNAGLLAHPLANGG